MAKGVTNCSVTLPEHLVAEILSKLPVKSLIRFRSVSKSWSTLIQSPHFIATHLHRQRRRSALLLSQHDVGLDYFSHRLPILFIRNEATSFRQLHLEPGVSIAAGSCNGLLLLSTNSYRGHRPSQYLIWNPATHESTRIPECPTYPSGMFNPGFGFDSKSNNFKVVAFAYNGTAVLRAQIFSVNSGSWTRPRHKLPALGFVFLSRSIEVAGALFWLGTATDRKLLEAGRKFLLSFDLGSEVFREITVPSSCNYSCNESTMRLCVFNDSLALLNNGTDQRFNDKAIDLWVMTKTETVDGGNHEECWTKLLTLGPFSQLVSPVGIWNDQVILKRWYENSQSLLFLYNIDNKQCQHLLTDHSWNRYEALTYVESLVPACSNQKKKKKKKEKK